MSRFGRVCRAVAVTVAAISALSPLAAQAANLPLAAVGPTSPVHPFPLWYQDSTGLQLEPCLDTSPQLGFPGSATVAPGFCAIPTGPATGLNTVLNPTAVFDGTKPVAFPTNFPGTVVYGSVNAELPVAGNARGLVYTAQLVGTFNPLGAGFDPGTPQVVTQIKITSTVTLPAGTYTITHPYGVLTITNAAAGSICSPANQGGRNPCIITFPANPLVTGPSGVLAQNLNVGEPTLGTFLTVNPLVFTPPAGFVGDGAARTQITGSPLGNNFVRIEGLGVGTAANFACTNGATTDCVENNGLFGKNVGLTVTGKRVDPANSPATRYVITPATPISAGVPVTVTVNASDVNGNPASGYSGTAAITLSDPQGTTVPPSTIAFAAGTATFELTAKSAGALDITLTDTVSPAFTATLPTTVQAGPAVSLAVNALPASVTAGTPAAFQVVALDAFGNIDANFSTTFPGALVSFASSDPQAILPAPTALTGGQGLLSATFGTAGAQTLTVSVAATLLTGTASTTVGPGSASAIAAVSGAPQTLSHPLI